LAGGTFSISRTLYAFDTGVEIDPKAKGKDTPPPDPVVESVCTSVERAIWCEVKRCKRSIDFIRTSMESVLQWLAVTESQAISLLHRQIADQWSRESATNERLVWMIYEKIESCVEIAELWEVAPDAIAVSSDKLIIPDAAPPPLPKINIFHDDNLNMEQENVLRAHVEELAQGGKLLREDLINLVAMCSSSVASGSNRVGIETVVEQSSLCLPPNLANSSRDYSGLSVLLHGLFGPSGEQDGAYSRRVGLPDETYGVVDECSLRERMHSFVL